MNQSGESYWLHSDAATHSEALSVHVPECVVDLHSQILACSPGFAAMLGSHEPVSFVGRTLLDFVHPSSVAALDAGSVFPAVYDGADSGDVRLVRLDGVEIEVHSTIDVVEVGGTPARRLTFSPTA